MMNQFIRSAVDVDGLNNNNSDVNNNINNTNSNNNNVICGEKILRHIKMDGCTAENYQDCERSYALYIPTSICNNINANGDDYTGGIIPLVFAMHCLGCPGTVMEHWQQIGEEYNFVVVIPEGIQHSWNAKYCCGYALRKQLNDVDFLQSIILELNDEYNAFISSQLVYGLGWSNGGYMVTYASKLFRAIAPISGYQYDDLLHITDNRPVGIFMHHSSNDPMVQITGCCADPSKPKCCCSISNNAQQCISITTIFEQWSTQVNHCTSNETAISFSNNNDNKHSTEDQVQCITATSNDCVANTTLCIYEDKKHFNNPSFEKAFPLTMTHEIAHFFAADACSFTISNYNNGGSGIWSSATKQCMCNNDNIDVSQQQNAMTTTEEHGRTKNTLYYCLEKDIIKMQKQQLHLQQQHYKGNNMQHLNNWDTFGITVIGMACLVVVAFIGMIIKKSKYKYIGWKRVSLTVDDDRSE